MIKYSNVDTWKYFLELNGKGVVENKVVYNNIIKELNVAFMETLAIEGGNMNLGGLNGHLVIQRLERSIKKMIPDFPTSNQIKKDIIARGGVPLENYRDENNKLTGENNGGEAWLVYFTDKFYYKIQWKKHKFAPHSYRNFNFSPIKFTRLNTSRILKENPDRAVLVHTDKNIPKFK